MAEKQQRPTVEWIKRLARIAVQLDAGLDTVAGLSASAKQAVLIVALQTDAERNPPEYTHILPDP